MAKSVMLARSTAWYWLEQAEARKISVCWADVLKPATPHLVIMKLRWHNSAWLFLEQVRDKIIPERFIILPAAARRCRRGDNWAILRRRIETNSNNVVQTGNIVAILLFSLNDLISHVWMTVYSFYLHMAVYGSDNLHLVMQINHACM